MNVNCMFSCLLSRRANKLATKGFLRILRSCPDVFNVCVCVLCVIPLRFHVSCLICRSFFQSVWVITGDFVHQLHAAGGFGFQSEPLIEGKNIIVTTRSHGTGAVTEAVDACEPTEVNRVGGAGHKVSQGHDLSDAFWCLVGVVLCIRQACW